MRRIKHLSLLRFLLNLVLNHHKMGVVGILGVVPQEFKSKAPVSQLVSADDTSVIEIKTLHYIES